MRRVAIPLLVLALAACNREAPEPEAIETEVPEELVQDAAPVAAADDSVGTPMEERVATIGLLNKRNNISQDLEMKPGEARRIGNVVVRLSACEKTAPWEINPEEGAFVQVLVRERADAESDLEWRRVFSGWLFKNSPGVNVVQHPIYDVWVKSCAMRFPGEEAPAPSPSRSANPSGSASAAPSPTPTPASTPTPEAPTA
jgi:hypothetical protein